VAHLSGGGSATNENPGKSITDIFTESFPALRIPVLHGLIDIIVDIHSIEEQVFASVVSERPWVTEGSGHRIELLNVLNSFLTVL